MRRSGVRRRCDVSRRRKENRRGGSRRWNPSLALGAFWARGGSGVRWAFTPPGSPERERGDGRGGLRTWIPSLALGAFRGLRRIHAEADQRLRSPLRPLLRASRLPAITMPIASTQLGTSSTVLRPLSTRMSSSSAARCRRADSWPASSTPRNSRPSSSSSWRPATGAKSSRRPREKDDDRDSPDDRRPLRLRWRDWPESRLDDDDDDDDDSRSPRDRPSPPRRRRRRRPRPSPPAESSPSLASVAGRSAREPSPRAGAGERGRMP